MTIKELINRSGKTAYQINLDTGIPISTIQSWLAGNRVANLSTLKLVYYLSKTDKELKQNIEKLIKKIG